MEVVGTEMSFKFIYTCAVSLTLVGCGIELPASQDPTPEIEQNTDTSIKFDPQNSELHYKKGMELLSSGNDADLRLAKVAFQIALKSDIIC